MKKTDLLQCITSPTLAKLGKNGNVQTDSIANICKFLKCQPEDIMEYREIEEGQDFYSQPFSIINVLGTAFTTII